MRIPTDEKIAADEMRQAMKKWPWVKIILIAFAIFYFTFFGRIAWGSDQNYVSTTWEMDIAQQIANAWDLFNEDIDRDFTDMGIVLAQRKLARRIDFILSQHEIEIDERKEARHERYLNATGIVQDSIGDNH